MSRLDSLRQNRARSVGVSLIAIMGFLIAGFVFQPIASSIDNIAPFVDDLEVPFPDFPDEPNFEEPVTSDDPIVTQIGDENIDNPISVYPTSETIGLLVEVTKIDSEGVRTTEEFRQEFVPLAFLGEQDTGRDFSEGSLEFRIWIETESQVSFNGNGFFSFRLNGVSDSGLVGLVVAGIPDQSGLIPVGFVTTEGSSQLYKYSIAQNIEKFPLDSTTEVSARVFDFNVLQDLRDEFTIDSATVFTMDIINSQDAVVLENEEGGVDIIFPNDDTLKISASTQGGNLPIPVIGSVSVVDEEQTVLATSSGTVMNTADSDGSFGESTSLVDLEIARNSRYTLQVGLPTPLSFVLDTPISQKNYGFSCRLYYDESVTTTGLNVTSVEEANQFIIDGQLNPETLPVICNMPQNQQTIFSVNGEIIG